MVIVYRIVPVTINTIPITAKPIEYRIKFVEKPPVSENFSKDQPIKKMLTSTNPKPGKE